jgi:hypothetical protein
LSNRVSLIRGRSIGDGRFTGERSNGLEIGGRESFLGLFYLFPQSRQRLRLCESLVKTEHMPVSSETKAM